MKPCYDSTWGARDLGGSAPIPALSQQAKTDGHLGIEEGTDIDHSGVIETVIDELPNLFVQRCLTYNVTTFRSSCFA
jgi:hypothetical protein